ncbi:MAG: hypothetical protein ACLPX5_07910, partial [Dissulfurispiraceae bacterium]
YVGRCVTGRRKAAYERLEPYVGKLTRTVLMGLGFSNEPWLPDYLWEAYSIGTLISINGYVYWGIMLQAYGYTSCQGEEAPCCYDRNPH